MDYLAKFKEHSLYTEKFKVFLNYEPTVCDREAQKSLQVNLPVLPFTMCALLTPTRKSLSLKTFRLP